TIPPPAMLLNSNGLLFGRGPMAAPPFAQLDANGDGKISKDELAAYYRKAGMAPFQVGNPASTFGRSGGFAVTRTGGMAGPGNTDAINAALFKLLDTNGAGKL